MTKRKAISKKIRFEIFKRDSFKCQYCGKSAPEAILHIDHIVPVSKGGDNDITNLITACKDCNSGKCATKLNDKAVIEKRKKQLDELQERREQIEMLYEWHSELLNIEDESAEAVTKLWENLIPGTTINYHGIETIKKLIRQYGLNEVIESLKISVSQYLIIESGKYKNESLTKTFKYINLICKTRKNISSKPYLKDLFYIRGILRKRFNYVNELESLQILENSYNKGLDVSTLKEIAIKSSSYTQWKNTTNNWAEED